MKTNVKLLSAIALLASACTTGSMVTSSRSADDVYYTPGDNPPVVASKSPSKVQQVKRPAEITESRQNEAGKIVDNYRLNNNDNNNDDYYTSDSTYVYNEEQPDSTYESDEEAQSLINNYND